MKKYVSNSLKALAGCLVGLSTPACFGLTSCSNNSAIQFANYESYMADDLMEDLEHNYNIHFPSYTVAEMIPAKFEKFYDCAVPCGYELMSLLRNGWLHKIDWSKFEVTDVTSADEALSKLYIGDAEGFDGFTTMNLQFAQYIKGVYDTNPNDKLIQVLHQDQTWSETNPNKFNLLSYGVPYFSQCYMFAYTGSELTFYHNNNGTPVETTEPTWADIFYTISPSNPKQDDRFKSKKIGMVDDARSFHDISRIVETQENGDQPSLDPIPDASLDRVQETMKHITDKFAGHSGSFVLNSDSAIVSRGLADRRGDQTAVLSWSGDTIYASQGAEEFDPFTCEDFHIQKAKDASFDEIEYVVINKKNESTPSKLNSIYSVVKQVCLDGCDKTMEEICEKESEEEDARYKYWTMVNWDTVMYTPLLKNIYQAVAVTSETPYWEEQMKESEYSKETVENLFINILNGKTAVPGTTKRLYGKTLTALQNSNNHWAWLQQKERL